MSRLIYEPYLLYNLIDVEFCGFSTRFSSPRLRYDHMNAYCIAFTFVVGLQATIKECGRTRALDVVSKHSRTEGPGDARGTAKYLKRPGAITAMDTCDFITGLLSYMARSTSQNGREESAARTCA